jgi:hypothetical protein
MVLEHWQVEGSSLSVRCVGVAISQRLKKRKKWQITYIAPLQPPTLATFRSWGSSAGAGRVRPAVAKIHRSK